MSSFFSKIDCTDDMCQITWDYSTPPPIGNSRSRVLKIHICVCIYYIGVCNYMFLNFTGNSTQSI